MSEILIPIIAISFPFLTAIVIVMLAMNGPKAKAKAEIMKAEAMARLDEKRNLLTDARIEETSMTVSEQDKRIEKLEEEVAFLRKLMEQK
jgi:hypothetical protein